MTRLLQNFATSQSAIRPDAIALVMDQTKLTYRQLDEQSNRLAQLLRQMGCRRGDRVCLFLKKGPAAVMAMHGVMKADCVYVPIDLSSPALRSGRIVQSCRPKVILVDQSATKLLDEVQPASTSSIIGTIQHGAIGADHFRTQFDANDIDQMDASELSYENNASDAAHIMFTSGSTGNPKGVVITHENACHFVDWGREYFGIDPEDHVSSHPPLHFDLSTFDIFGTLSAGGHLHMVPEICNLVPTKLASFIREAELTQWFSVPSALTLMAKYDALDFGDFPHLKRVLWCGEVLPTTTLIHWMERLPHVTFTNLYGPTEATIASSYFTVPQCPQDSREEIPIGRACDGEELLVLDADLQPAPTGEQGDLYIRGAGLSPGYWEDRKKTDEVFLARRDSDGQEQRVYRTGDLAYADGDGLVYFLGRTDSQIKSRGYRIELGEIEAAMNALNVLKDCAVVGVPTGGFEGTAICCAYVPQSDIDVSPQSLRSMVSKLIPRYMLPARWKDFPQLPKNGNGKTDRRSLVELFETNEQAHSSRTPADS